MRSVFGGLLPRPGPLDEIPWRGGGIAARPLYARGLRIDYKGTGEFDAVAIGQHCARMSPTPENSEAEGIEIESVVLDETRPADSISDGRT